MSSALVRQALAFVDPEDNETKKKKRSKANRRSNSGQDSHPYKSSIKRKSLKEEKSEEDTVDSKIKKLLALSAPVSKPKIAKKILERAAKGKPLLEKVEKKVEKEQSILFPEDNSFQTSKKR
ncbi:unnamed protein product [Leptosia nina]|uniref:Uncharacterized protein n=1 Tax=Leptosia nina TaxID=320188 RepID=A0AAV1JEJ1_9NEOP